MRKRKEKMFPVERQEKILAYINEHKTVTTTELAAVFGMTSVTIRSDINALAELGLVLKTHGGAVTTEQRLNLEVPIRQKMQLQVREKQRIGAAAAAMIAPGDMVILDSGSTTLAIAKRITAREVTVITNDVFIAKTLIDNGIVRVHVTGGRASENVYSLSGRITEDYLSGIQVNKLFLGCDAIDFDWGISNRTEEEVATKQAMIAASKTVIAVADSSKFGKRVFERVCKMDALDILITDKLTESEAETLNAIGIETIICKQTD